MVLGSGRYAKSWPARTAAVRTTPHRSPGRFRRRKADVLMAEQEARHSDIRDGASAPGVPFAYAVAREEIDKQEAAIREVNSRLGFLLAAGLTFGTFYFKEVNAPWLMVLVGVALILVLGLILIGYVPRTHLRAPNPHAVTAAANEPPGRIKELALGTMLQAFDQNKRVISAKNRYYAAALTLGVVAVIAGVGAETWSGVVHLWAEHGKTVKRSAATSALRCTNGHRGSGTVQSVGGRRTFPGKRAVIRKQEAALSSPSSSPRPTTR